MKDVLSRVNENSNNGVGVTSLAKTVMWRHTAIPLTYVLIISVIKLLIKLRMSQGNV